MSSNFVSGFPTHVEKIGGLLRISLQLNHKMGSHVESYLMQNLSDLQSPRYIPKKEDLTHGQISIGKFDDNQYYRIKIVEHLPHNNVSVLFIDYGNQASLPLSDIRLLNTEVHRELLEIAPLALTCFLENVCITKAWNEDEFSTLKKLVLYEDRHCAIRPISNNVRVINIFFPNAYKKLTEMILENDLGRPISDAEMLIMVNRMNSRLAVDERGMTQTAPQQFPTTMVNEAFVQERTFLREMKQSHMLPAGSSHNVYISHMEDGPYSFSIQLKSSAEDSLVRLTTLLRQEKPILNTVPLLPGAMVMTYVYGENSYKRSIVMNVKRNICQVYHMDYGSIEEVPFSDIYQLPSPAHHAPAMALRFCLADIKSLQVSDSAKTYFSNLLQGKQALIKVTKQESEGPLLQYCEMFYEGRNVKDILIAFNSPLEYTNQHPPRGKDIKVAVSHIVSPSLFFIQYCAKLDLIKGLQTEVNAYCMGQSRLENLNDINIGNPVGALFEDNIWYRGMVVGVNIHKGLATVSYVDYGNRSEIKAGEMCHISRDLVTKWRAQAVECCLVGFERENTADEDDKILIAMEGTLNQTFNMTPLQILPGNLLLVELIDDHGRKLSEKILSIKAHISQQHQVSNVQNLDKRCDSPGKDSDKSVSDSSSKDDRPKNDNFFVRPNLRPLLETQKKNYGEHDDRFNASQKPAINNKRTFEKPSHSKLEERLRKNKDIFEDKKPKDIFNESADEWSPGSQEPAGYITRKSNFFQRPNPDNVGKSYSKGSHNEDINKGFSDSHPRHTQTGRFRPDIGDQNKSFNRPGRNVYRDHENADNKVDRYGDSRGTSMRKDVNQERFGESRGASMRKDTNEERFGDSRVVSIRKDNNEESFGDSRVVTIRKDNIEERFGDSRAVTIKKDTIEERFGDSRAVTIKKDTNDERFGDSRVVTIKKDPNEENFSRNDGPKPFIRNFDRSRTRPVENSFKPKRNNDNSNNYWQDNEDQTNRGDEYDKPISKWNNERGGRRDGFKFGEKKHDSDNFGGYNNKFNSKKRDLDEMENDGSRGGRPGGKFDGRRHDDGGVASRFNNRNERKGNRYQNEDSTGHREDFRKKKFESNNSSRPVAAAKNFSLSEEWESNSPSMSANSTYPSQTLAENTELKVFISSFTNPNTIYAQKVDCESTLDELKTLINNIGEVLTPIMKDCLAPGVPVLARYSDDNALYRGIVKKLIFPSSATVLFVDYGNGEDISISDLYLVPAKILAKPPQAFHCMLSDISPVEGIWPDDMVATLEEYLSASEAYTIRVNSLKMVDGEMVISASLTDPRGQSVSQLLVDNGIAVFNSLKFSLVPPLRTNAENVSEPINSVIEEREESIGKEMPIGEAELFPDWTDRFDLLIGQRMYAEILELLDKEEKSFTLKIIDAKVVTLAVLTNCESLSYIASRLKVIVDIQGVHNDKLQVKVYNLNGIELGHVSDESSGPQKICLIPLFPVVRKEDDVYITHIEDSDYIYIQRCSDTDKLVKLAEELSSFYNSVPDEEISWAVGDLCCIKSENDSWFRGKIIDVEGDYKVRHLDYGKTEVVPQKNLRKLDERFFFCEFALKVMFPIEWTIPNPLERVANQKLTCKLVRNPKGQWIADLEYPSGERLCDYLIEKNIVKDKLYSLFNEANSTIGYFLKAKEEVGIMISHADSPTLFWAHLSSDTGKVYKLQETLQELIVQTTEEASDTDLVFGALYSEDSKWYRASRVSENSLRFIDYGNTDKFSSPKKLPNDLIRPTSGYAVPMYLCAQPTNGEWSEKAVDKFQDFIERENTIAKIINVNYKIVVDLKEGDNLLSEILINDGYATYCDYVPDVVKKHINEPLLDSYSCRLFSSISNGNGNLDSQPLTMKVFFTHINSPNDFYVVDESKSDFLSFVQCTLCDVGKEKPVPTVTIGECYAAKFEDEWFRAKVIQKEPEIVVIYIDYGNTSSPTEIRLLPNSLVSQPPLAIHCSLDTENSPEINSNLITFCGDGLNVFNMTIKSFGNPNIVYMFDENGIDLLKFLKPSLIYDVDLLQSDSKREKVNLSHIIGPDCFYVQKYSDMATYKKVADQMMIAESFSKNDIAIGDIIAAQYPDDSLWYRAKVLSLEPELKVSFIDFGNSSTILEYRELPTDIKQIKSLSTNCSLHLPDSFDIWPKESVDLFISECNKNCDKLEIEFISQDTDNSIVELYVNGEPLSQKLLNSFGESSNTDGIIDSTGTKEVNSDKTAVIRGYITHINSLSDFYIQREDCANLMEQIRSGLSILDDNSDGKPDCGLGSLIAAKFVDGEWYRGLILQIDPLRVRFIDYGNECNVSQISSLSDELHKIAPVAMNCCLNSDKEALKENTTKKLFKKLYGNVETLLDIHIKSFENGLYTVDMFINGKNIVDELLSDSNFNKSGVEEIPSKETAKMKGYVSHINSVSDFFIQEYSNSTEVLSMINDNLNECCLSAESPKSYDIGDIVGAKDTDDCWYRAEIIEIKPEVRVRFIDFGNDRAVTDFKSLPSHILDQPAVAIRCSLQTESLKLVSSLDQEFVKICGDPETLFDFSIITSKDGLNTVQIFDEWGEDILLKCSSNSEKELSEGTNENVIELEAMNNTSNSSDDLVDDTSTNVTLAKENNTTYSLTSTLNPLEYQTQDPISCSLSKTLDNIELTDTNTSCKETPSQKKVISNVNNILDFYINIDNPEFGVVEKAFEEVDSFESPTSINIGDILACKSNEEKWYRCRVDEKLENGSNKVFLIDYGSLTTVNELKILPENILAAKPNALHCTLYTPETVKCWYKGASDKFIEISDSVFEYKIFDNSVSPCIVQLTSPEGDVSNFLTIYNIENEISDTTGSGIEPIHENPIEDDETDTVTKSKINDEVSTQKKEIETITEIRANAEQEIVTNSSGCSPEEQLEKEPLTSEPKGVQQSIEQLETQLPIQTDGKEEHSLSNLTPDDDTPTSPNKSQSPNHTVAENTATGSISLDTSINPHLEPKEEMK